jgi:hypothetical protein
MVRDGDYAGPDTTWLVRTADPATRAGTSGAEFSASRRDTVLGLGTIDAAGLSRERAPVSRGPDAREPDSRGSDARGSGAEPYDGA